MAGSMAVFGVRSRFEVQHWHVNGNFALATLLGFALTFLKMKMISEGRTRLHQSA
jgi:hypothetical protein